MTSEESALKLADFLDHIAEASRLARDYVAGMSKESFLKDRRTQQAVVLNLMVIGEAAARIVNEHKEFAAAHSQIPLAQDARHAQPDGARLFRRRSEHRLGYRPIVTSQFAVPRCRGARRAQSVSGNL